jgi:hypothetical protein
MKNFKLLLILIACANILTACKKDKTAPTELSKLPAATQTGAKTFGCLVNGVAFVSDNGCTYLCSPSMQVGYDLNSNGGQFFVNGDNYILKASVGFGLDSCVSNKRYTYINSPNYPIRFGFLNNNNLCSLSTRVDPTVIASGYVEITKFDLTNGIISGTFEFTLSKNGCETKTITNGRFDAKL